MTQVAHVLRRTRGALTPAEWRRAAGLAVVIVGLHAVGFFLLLAVVAPHHYALGASGVFGVGLGITAYTLGLRHAFDADHIAAIDNTTRKLMSEGQRPLSVGFWFSLGHSTIVFALGMLVVLGVRGLSGAVADDASSLHQATGCRPARLRLVPADHRAAQPGGPDGHRAVFRRMRAGDFDEAELERELDKRGFMNRFSAGDEGGPQAVAHVPARVLFGLGFDTATEVALLVLAGARAAPGCPGTRSCACRSCSRPGCRCSTRSTARS